MACFYCKQDGFPNVPDSGDCIECRKAVCVEPPDPARTDNQFHAAECLCHCRNLVCEFHAARHSAAAGSTMALCFPSIALARSAEVVRHASTEMGKKRTASRLSPESVATFNKFLNLVMPGYGALGPAIDRSRDPGLREVTSHARDEGRGVALYVFAPEFYTEGAMERVAALALDTMAKAWHAGLTEKTRPGALGWLGSRMLRFLRETKLGRSLDASGVERLLLAMAPEGAEISSSLIRALTYAEVPADATIVADWVVSESVSMGAPA